MKLTPKIIRQTDRYFLKYWGKYSGVKTYTLEERKQDGEESAPFEKAVADNLRRLCDAKFDQEAGGLMQVENFHLEQIKTK